MANKNKNLIITYFPSVEEAEQGAGDLKHWDGMRGDVKLGGIGIITLDDKGKIKTHKVGTRAHGTGAKWGTILGAAAGIFSGGLTLIGGAVVGFAAGTVSGALFRKKIGMTDEDKDRLMKHLQDGGAALAVMADDEEVEPTKFELLSLGGAVESYAVPQDAADELETAADEADVEDEDEAVLLHEEDHAEEVATAAAAAAMVAASGDEEEDEGSDTAVLHFHRHNGDYDGWGIHVWTGYEGETSWEQPLPPAGSDDFGITFEVPLAEGAEGLAYIIHRGDERDLDEDQYLNLAENGREVWIVQNTPGYADAPEA